MYKQTSKDKHISKHTNIQWGNHKYFIQTGTKTNIQTERVPGRQQQIQSDIQTARQTKHTGNHKTNMQTENTQLNTQTQTHTHTYIHTIMQATNISR